MERSELPLQWRTRLVTHNPSIPSRRSRRSDADVSPLSRVLTFRFGSHGEVPDRLTLRPYQLQQLLDRLLAKLPLISTLICLITIADVTVVAVLSVTF